MSGYRRQNRFVLVCIIALETKMKVLTQRLRPVHAKFVGTIKVLTFKLGFVDFFLNLERNT